MVNKQHSTNVVRLPTAAPRQVQQRWNAATRAARQALRDACPWPGEYKYPIVRAREAEDAAKPSLAHIRRTPALVIAMAVFCTANEEHRRAALAYAELLDALHLSEATKDAVLLMEAATGMTNNLAGSRR